MAWHQAITLTYVDFPSKLVCSIHPRAQGAILYGFENQTFKLLTHLSGTNELIYGSNFMYGLTGSHINQLLISQPHSIIVSIPGA